MSTQQSGTVKFPGGNHSTVPEDVQNTYDLPLLHASQKVAVQFGHLIGMGWRLPAPVRKNRPPPNRTVPPPEEKASSEIGQRILPIQGGNRAIAVMVYQIHDAPAQNIGLARLLQDALAGPHQTAQIIPRKIEPRAIHGAPQNKMPKFCPHTYATQRAQRCQTATPWLLWSGGIQFGRT